MFDQTKSNYTISDMSSSVCTYQKVLVATLLFLILLLPMFIIPARAGKPGTIAKWAEHIVHYWIKDGTPQAQKDAIKRAAKQWTDVKCSCFTLVYVGQSRRPAGHDLDGINLVSFCNIDEDGRTGAQTALWVNPRTNLIYEADIHIDSSERDWDTERPCDPGKMDLETVAKHEFGHVAGLHDQKTQAEEVMFWQLGKCTSKNLGDDDKEAIRENYPSKHPPPPDGKKQSMTFEAPFNLNALAIPGSVTFELDPEHMIDHSLNLTVPDALGGGNVSLDFQSGYGEIFFSYTTEPTIVLFNITEWVMEYTEFYIPEKGWTGPNTAITSSESYGFLEITTGQMTVYETGIYFNDLYPQETPIEWWILYSGMADFASNVITLEGEGEAFFFTLRTDVNSDFKVNIQDLFIIAKAFGSTLGDDRWDSRADLDGDDYIGIKDVFAVAKDFGWSAS